MAPKVEWSSSLNDTIEEGDCDAENGDCLFACSAFWLNSALNTHDYDVLRMRFLAADHVTDEMFDIMNDDISTGEGLPHARSQRELQERISSTAWGCHSLIVALLKGIGALVQESVSAIIISKDAEPIVIRATEKDEPSCAIVLHYLAQSHYRIVGSRVLHNVVFVTGSCEFFSSLADLNT